MNVSAATLRQLHRIHKQRADLNSRLRRGPLQVKACEGALVAAVQNRDTAKEVLQRARMASDEKQLQLRQREARVKDLDGKLNACSTNKEYQALKEQIAADQQANSVLTDEILEALEKIDELQAAAQQRQQELEQTEAELKKVADRVAQERAGLEADLARVNAELQETEKLLQGDFREQYDRVAKARGEDSLAPVEGEFCGGCNQMLTAQTMNELYLAKPVFCKNCGCLLYFPEDRSVAPPSDS